MLHFSRQLCLVRCGPWNFPQNRHQCHRQCATHLGRGIRPRCTNIRNIDFSVRNGCGRPSSCNEIEPGRLNSIRSHLKTEETRPSLGIVYIFSSDVRKDTKPKYDWTPPDSGQTLEQRTFPNTGKAWNPQIPTSGTRKFRLGNFYHLHRTAHCKHFRKYGNGHHDGHFRFVGNAQRAYCTGDATRYLRVLGIESSCDDTGAAVVDSESRILGEALNSQAQLSVEMGGVMPFFSQKIHAACIEGIVFSFQS